MKYRHSYHAGNFADVHKHVALLALLNALQRKSTGFLYLETHAGRGSYDLSGPAARASGAARAGIGRLGGGQYSNEEIKRYTQLIAELRSREAAPQLYPGSPLIAAEVLRPQDRAVLCEIEPPEANALSRTLDGRPRMRLERGDGFELLRAHLPPPERRGLVFIDPPYEETRRDFERVTQAVVEALRRFRSAVIAVWYPIKAQREVATWQGAFGDAVDCETLVSELWLYPPDSKVALNGSGLAVVNPPYLYAERMSHWLPELYGQLDLGHSGGTRSEFLRRRGD